MMNDDANTPPSPAPTDPERRYSIGELAGLGGVRRRTVRYYVQRGLLATPTGVGRGRHYTRRHLDTLIRIRELQESGLPLAEIAARLKGREADGPPLVVIPPPGIPGPVPSPLARPSKTSTWTRIVIADGIELHLRGRRLDPVQARELSAAVHQIIPKRPPE